MENNEHCLRHKTLTHRMLIISRECTQRTRTFCTYTWHEKSPMIFNLVSLVCNP